MEKDKRYGTWFDGVVFFQENDQAKVLQMIKTGDAQFFAAPFASENMQAIIDAGLKYKLRDGLSFGYLINVAEFNNGVYNPFHSRKVRVALSNLVDRYCIVDDIMNGLGVPRVTTVDPGSPVYAEIFETARAVEIMASYNEDKAIAQIEEGLNEDGCVKGDDGKWYSNGEPVTVIAVICVEDERKEMGDYLSDQLGKIGFTVNRLYKAEPEATLVWVLSAPADGKWNFYVEDLCMEEIGRALACDHASNYTEMFWPVTFATVWKDNLDPDCRQACLDMMNGNYTTIAERHDMLARAEACTYQSGFHIWLVNKADFWVFSPGVDVTCDIAGGPFGDRWIPWLSCWWPRTMRKVDADGAPVAGGTIKIANPAFLVEPWNPVLGSNWLYDQLIHRPCRSELGGERGCRGGGGASGPRHAHRLVPPELRSC